MFYYSLLDDFLKTWPLFSEIYLGIVEVDATGIIGFIYIMIFSIFYCLALACSASKSFA